MKRSITPNQIKQNNRNLIYHYIYKNGKVSQQDISYDLRLSRPTVTANLTAMETDGLIQKCGSIDTEFVGRRLLCHSGLPRQYRRGDTKKRDKNHCRRPVRRKDQAYRP